MSATHAYTYIHSSGPALLFPSHFMAIPYSQGRTSRRANSDLVTLYGIMCIRQPTRWPSNAAAGERTESAGDGLGKAMIPDGHLTQAKLMK